MALTRVEAQTIALEFLQSYPGALNLVYLFRKDVAEFYGSRAAQVPSNFKGAYLPKETLFNGRIYPGRVDIPYGNLNDLTDAMVTLRHEVLGHYGANTFAPAEKRALLNGLIAARQAPSLKASWSDINRRYKDKDDSWDKRAEEVFASHCESVTPDMHIGKALVHQQGQKSFMETCIARTRLMQAGDLRNIALMVAQGLHDRSRTQQNFPKINALFRKGEAMEVAVDSRRSDPARIIEPVPGVEQRILDSLAVNAALPHLAGAASGLEALRAAGEGRTLSEAQRETLRGAFPDALIERHSDRFSRLGELAYMNATRRQAAVDRQSPGLSSADRATRSQQWQVAPALQQQQQQLLSRNIAQHEEEQDRKERLEHAREEIRHERRQERDIGREHAREHRLEQSRDIQRDRDGPAL